MKKVIIPILAAFIVGIFSTSCARDEFRPEVLLQTVQKNQWQEDGDDLVYSVQWPAIDGHMLRYGNVNGYVIEYLDNGTSRQVPMPYVFPVTFYLPDGSTATYGENVRLDFEYGVVTFVISDLGDLLRAQNDLPTFNFRVVATVPL